MMMPIEYLYVYRDRSAERRKWEKHYRNKGLVDGRKLNELVSKRMRSMK